MIAVIKGCGNNLGSITNALQKLDCAFILTSDPAIILSAEKVILPGVGAAGAAMQRLSDLGLVDIIKKIKSPFLGICVGMQVLYEFSQENNTPCLGIIPGMIKKFQARVNYPVPHMGWNQLSIDKQNQLFDGLKTDSFFYFVHSYYAAINDYTLATTAYDFEFTSVVKKDNFIGVQFHPEKSSKVGSMILKNFVRH